MKFRFESSSFEQAKEKIAKECNKITTHKITMNQNNIKPQELRIGNWVKCIHTASENERHQITGVTKENTYLNSLTFDYLTINDIETIPLSEEVLLKCGFEKTPNHENFYFINLNDWTKIYVSFFEDRFAVELSVSKHSFCPRVNSLHQLQNLFYSLTGEELEVSWT